jgi:hypothetical protein
MKRLEAVKCQYCNHFFVHSRWCNAGRSLVVTQLVRYKIGANNPKSDKPKIEINND